MAKILRLQWLSLLLVLKNSAILVLSTQEFTLVKREKMVQSSGKIRKVTVRTMSECLTQCLSECKCSAFDMRHIAVMNFSCYLRRYLNGTDESRLTYSTDHSHFDIKQAPKQYCERSRGCSSIVNCCLTSNPCSNGAKCVPTDDIRARFRCACPVQFSGKYCTECAQGFMGKNCSARITSCRGYANGSRVPQTYVLRDSENSTFKVFCDFANDSNITWTLIQSYSLHNRATFRKGLWLDIPKNILDPTKSWSSYRLPAAKMQMIQNDSTKWRVTCEFDKNLTAIERDSMRGSKADLDILTFNVFGKCKKVDYINIRGYNCSNCTVKLYQRPTYALHTDSIQAAKTCEFKLLREGKQCSNSGEDNFGQYECINPKHRCSATAQSTTQTWLGG